MEKCKHVQEFIEKPIVEVIRILSKDDFICPYCGQKVTMDDMINEMKEYEE